MRHVFAQRSDVMDQEHDGFGFIWWAC